MIVADNPAAQFPLLEQLGSDSFHSDPSDAFQSIHSDPGPGLYRHPLGEGLVLARYASLVEAMKHPLMQAQNRSDRVSGPSRGGAMASMFNAHPVFMNEPQHRPVRMAATTAIGTGRADWMREQITEIATELLEVMWQRGGGDLIGDLAFALSSRFYARLLALGEEDAGPLRRYALALARPLEFAPMEDALADADAAAGEVMAMAREARKRSGTAGETYALVQTALDEVTERGLH